MTGSIDDPRGIQDLLLFRLSRILAIGGGLVTRLCEGQHGITRREWAVMALVGQADELRWSKLVEQSEIDEAPLSRAISSLVAKGLVSKRRVPSQGVWVSLTDPGRTVFAEIFPVTRSINLRLLEGMDRSELTRLDSALHLMHANAVAAAEEAQLPKANRRRGRP